MNKIIKKLRKDGINMEENPTELSRVNRQKNKQKKRKWPKVLLSILLLLAAIFTYGYLRVRKTTDTIHTDLSDEEFMKESHASRDKGDVKLTDKEAFSVLLMGIDTGDKGREDRGRSDTMMVMTVNPKNKKTTILSIPRDTRTEIIGKGIDDKINHAYAFGGPTMSMNTVQNLLDIPIDYFVSVNMKGIQQIVDAVGGVTVNPEISFSQDGYSFTEGQSQKIDGAVALAYSRMRKQDPEGDYGRQARQRELVLAILDRASSFESILNFESVLKTMENNVQTNLRFNDMMTISVNYLSALSNVEQIQMEGEGTKINGIYYAIISEEEKSKISNELKKELEITD